MAQKIYDAIVIGGGAAGLMTAWQLGLYKKKVLLLEQNDRLGKKILISGGGRCNFTNKSVGPDNYKSSNRHFMKSALSQFRPDDFVRLIEDFDIEYYEKTLGQLFCRKSSKLVVEMLENLCKKARVQIGLQQKVSSVQKTGELFEVFTDKESYKALNVIIAAGGPSFSKLGGNGSGYRIAEGFGHKIVKPEAALVPLKYEGRELKIFGDLSGVSFPCEVSIKKTKFKEAVLFTHRGLSGPAILQISLYWQGVGEPVTINWWPEGDIESLIEEARQSRPQASIQTLLKDKLPSSFVEKWLDYLIEDYKEAQVANLPKKQINKLIEGIHRYQSQPSGTEGFEKAEVTRGGVDVKDVSSKTLESKLCPGLYFVGEVLDVTGWLGGYNFQWAWASGYTCAKRCQAQL